MGKHDVATGDLNSKEKGTGARRNSGKVDLSLVPLHLLAGTSRVMMSGEIKYNRDNWAKGMGVSKTFSCLLRHLFKWFYCREELDQETLEHHLDHAFCNLFFLKHYTKTHPGGDDRPAEWTDFADWLDDINTPFDAEGFINRNPWTVEEDWKPIKGYETEYEISTHGRIRSLTRKIKSSRKHRIIPGQIIKPIEKDDGYLLVSLAKGGKSKQRKVHQLVLETFECPRPKGMDACHNDGDKQNNFIGNLRWDTRSENLKDKFKHGYRNSNSRSVKRSDGETFLSMTDAAKASGTTQSAISATCRGRQKQAGGFGWTYI